VIYEALHACFSFAGIGFGHCCSGAGHSGAEAAGRSATSTFASTFPTTRPAWDCYAARFGLKPTEG